MDSHKVSRAPQYSGVLTKEVYKFHLQGYHPLWLAFPRQFDYLVNFVTPQVICNLTSLASHYPCCTTVTALYMQTGLGYSHFARRY